MNGQQEKLTVLDLFSGIGGFSLGLDRAGFRTIAFCEIEPFYQQVLQKHWPEIPIATDINQLSYENGALYDAGRLIYEGEIDLICGGFPCQPFSVAGRKKGQLHRISAHLVFCEQYLYAKLILARKTLSFYQKY